MAKNPRLIVTLPEADRDELTKFRERFDIKSDAEAVRRLIRGAKSWLPASAPRQPLPPTNPIRPAFEHPDPVARLASLPVTIPMIVEATKPLTSAAEGYRKREAEKEARWQLMRGTREGKK